ncbi:TPA: hypothetical protein N2O40_004541 [Escherichia coli]|nr:hypothetical protein [Escherichia coli O157]EFC1680853.1 hypothetical protein [Escherichia coli]EOW17766.1 hypothetical protein A1WU_04487 [Escherichia coli KTE108]MBS2868146.1 hypothetical protein [Klebsiella pneumoniae]HDS7751084.1 hypothetical protein [Klebsiella pneumoniae subsp. pneumoniae]
MQWIDEKDLVTWAKRTDARALLVDMVADLIRATIPDANRYRFRFPGGDVGQVRGWDGDLETVEAVGFIPAGKSKWEFGAGAGAAKASKDYEKRTEKTASEIMTENAFVLVNLEAWDTPREMLTKWEDERKAEGKWREVKYIDAVTLVHWLDSHPAVAAKYARDVLGNAPKEGALSTDEYWEEFSNQFTPRLSEKVVIGDRQKAADELITKLLGPAGTILIGAETAEDVVAFAVAAIRSAEPEKRVLLESRTLIVRTESAARELSRKSGLAFIATKGAEPLAGVLSLNCPTLSAATGALARKYQPLERPSASSMAQGFMLMGLDLDQGYELAQRCGRSLTILKRLIPNGAPVQPEWISKAVALKSAFLAGGWSSNVQMDCDLLKELGGFNSYTDLDSVLMPMLALSDRPIDKVGEVWKTRAPVDAFYFYGQQVTDADLNRFRDAVVKVFSHVALPPARNEKFSLNYSAPAEYSNWLRDGLALTLVIIASMHGVAGLHINGKTPQQYVDEVVAALPDWGRSHHSIIRLGDQAALFAEAAPNPFLTALESILEGSPEDLVEIFGKEDGSILGPSSPHIQFLWALEAIAWDPKYLNRSALVLAKLAEIDPEPDSKLINRPINSLREILLSWSPNTYAPQERRIACLDAILSASPEVGWQLLLKLLPRQHDLSSRTHHPKIRDLAPKVTEEITFGLVWDFEAAIVNRALVSAGNDEERITMLIGSFGAFQAESRALILAQVDNYLDSYQTDEGCKVWYALLEEAARHNYFSDSEWAIKPEERASMDRVVERHRPVDPLVKDRQVFDDWLPHIGKYQPGGATFMDLDEMRKEVLERVLLRDGVEGILRLARMVKLPSLIGPALRHTSISMEQMIELLHGTFNHGALKELAFNISAVGAAHFGDQWKEVFAERVLAHVQDEPTKVRLLLGWPQDEATWSLVDSLGSQIREMYWTQIHLLPIHGTLEQLLYAIDQLRQHNRDIDVLGLVHLRLKDLSTDLIQALLIKGVSQVEGAAKRMGTMLSYYVSQALTELRKRSDAQEINIARIEYAYLPVIRFEEQSLSIIGLMTRAPDLFVDVLSHVFRGKSTAPAEVVTDEMKARAQASYGLLNAFKTVPGINGVEVDSDILAEWVSQARSIAATKDLTEICDIQIGKLLAHAPSNTNKTFWPPSAVCKVIEDTASSDLESGFRIECHNKRGAYTKTLNEGGDQERYLAEQYQQWADSAHLYPRTSVMLANIADSWLRLAADEDIRAEQDKMKW